MASRAGEVTVGESKRRSTSVERCWARAPLTLPSTRALRTSSWRGRKAGGECESGNTVSSSAGDPNQNLQKYMLKARLKFADRAQGARTAPLEGRE